jgi:integrase/recombinase XerC
MNAVITDYLRDLRRANLSRATVVRRRSCIFTLQRWLDPRSLGDATSDDLDRMLDERRVSPRTRYHWISHLHCFYAWGVARGHLPADPTATMIRPRLPKLLPRPIADADLEMALLCAQPTMRSWLCLAAFGGLRCAEIAGLDAADILPAVGLIRVYGKGDKERMVPLHEHVACSLRGAGVAKHGPLWTPVPTPARLSQQANQFLSGLGIDDTMHSLRHWFGTKLYASSGDLRLTQELMGHASPTTTAQYVAWHRPAAADAVARIELPSQA